MKLQIKHLSPYLPYELKVRHTLYHGHETIDTLEGLCYECATFEKSCDYYFEQEEDNECDIKPLLRPMSDLIKLITHEGKKFIPIDELDDLFGQTISLNEEGGLLVSINLESHCLVQKLFEWHFDVFGLIDKGLAIKKSQP